MTRKTAEKASVREGAAATAAAGLVDDRSKRPGFKIPRKTARLQFEGEEFEGCEIVVALDVTFEAGEYMEGLLRSGDEEKNREALGFFAENGIISWNLEDAEGKAIPLSADSFLKLPGWFGLLILNGWKQAAEKAAQISVPLDSPSKNGDKSEEPSVMTEAQSSVLPS